MTQQKKSQAQRERTRQMMQKINAERAKVAKIIDELSERYDALKRAQQEEKAHDDDLHTQLCDADDRG